MLNSQGVMFTGGQQSKYHTRQRSLCPDTLPAASQATPLWLTLRRRVARLHATEATILCSGMLGGASFHRFCALAKEPVHVQHVCHLIKGVWDVVSLQGTPGGQHAVGVLAPHRAGAAQQLTRPAQLQPPCLHVGHTARLHLQRRMHTRCTAASVTGRQG